MYTWQLLASEIALLDDLYQQKYFSIEPDYFQKNCIALLTELGEFANETKCFKYWSTKPAKEEEMLEELADCIIYALQFVHYFNIELGVLPATKPIDQPLVLLNELFLMSSCLMNDVSDSLILQVFVSLIQLGECFHFTEQQMIQACYKKVQKCKDRMITDY